MTLISKDSILDVNLQLFAEGGDGGTSGGATADGGLATSESGENSQNANNVSIPEAQNETVDRDAEFDKLVKGDYKDSYGKKVKEAVEKRVKGMKEQLSSYESLNPALDLLRSRYGLEDVTDVQALAKAIEDDDSFYEAEALEKGMPVSEIKRFHRIEKENAAFRKADQDRIAQEQRAQVFARWEQQTNEAKEIYPNFDFDAEFDNNPLFRALLGNGFTVKSAFQATHVDEIMAEAMQYAAKTAEKRVADNIAANGARPTENGVSPQSASVTKVDLSKMTNAEMDDYIRRARNGEIITF